MRRLLAPLDALRADATTTPGNVEIERGGGAWVVVAQALHRMADLPRDERLAYGTRLLRAWAESDVLAGHVPADLLPALAGALQLDGAGASTGAEPFLRVLGQLVEDMEKSGAFHLAFSTLGLGLVVFADAGLRARGLVLVQQARVARQLGDLATAAELYDLADGTGRAAGDPEVRGRAAVGHGLIANMRGNYPAAREAFGAALALAGQVPGVSLLAHHGLMTGAISARDVETALVHGWRAFAGTVGEADRRADLLANLGEVARMAHAPAVAMACYLASLRLTQLCRVRLAALAGAALAAVEVGDMKTLDRLSADVEATIARSNQPYENAFALVELAEAHAAAGRPTQGREYVARAAVLAGAGGFHEVGHRVVLLQARLRRMVAEPGSPAASADLRAGRRAVVSLTDAADGVLGRLARLPADPAELVALEV